MKTLIIANLDNLSKEQVEQLVEFRKESEIFFPVGEFKGKQINSNLLVGNPVSLDNIETTFSSFDEKFIVPDASDFAKEFILHFNLQKSDEFKVLNFEEPENPVIESLMKSVKELSQTVSMLTQQVAEAKTLLAAILSVQSEENKETIKKVYAESHNKISKSIQISNTFLEIWKGKEGEFTVIQMLQELEKQLKLKDFTDSASRLYLSMINATKEDQMKVFNEKKDTKTWLLDQNLINAIIAASHNI